MEENVLLPVKLDASHLGRLLVMQAVVGSLPDEKAIIDFVCRGLTDMPGVDEASYRDEPGEIVGDERVRFPLRVGNAGYGELRIRLTDASAFMPYEPYMRNFSLMLAVILGERDLRRINESHAVRLEEIVRERTGELRREIAERESIEGSLRESEARFRATFEQMAMGIAHVDPDGRWLRVNRKLCDIVGYTRDELLAKTFQDITHPDDLDTDVGYMRQVLAGEFKTYSMEKRYFRKDGSIVWINLTVSLVRDDHGQPQYFIAAIEDIGDRKRTEVALRESEERYRRLFEHMHEGFAYCRMIFENGDPVDYIFLSVNASFETLSGLKNVEGKRVSEVIPGIRASDPSMFEIYGRVALTGNPEKVELFVESLRQWFLIYLYSPEPEYFVAVFDVISDRKRAEAEKEKLQAQLQQAMKMEAVGRLAGGVAHDFNNLLTVIIGNVSLALAKVPASGAVADMLSEVNMAAQRAARLTQQLLAFSRRQIIEPKVLDLNGLIVELHSMLVRLIGENIELKTVPGKGLEAVKVDPGQMEQILVNLAVNARDAMPDGGKLLIETSNVELDDAYCAAHPGAAPGRFVLLSVSDTGHGMTDEVKSQIFEPFFTTKPKGSGTGLGLSMTCGAVEQAGGSIAVHSEVGKGTTVRIYLPRAGAETVKPVEPDLSQELLDGTETVLLVEDEDVVRNLCVQVLERLGYKVLYASNGAAAIGIAQEYGDRIDLLMTDVVMPGMNGSELATRLVILHPETRVLFTSGYTDDAIVHHGVLDAGVSFIGKPYTPSALARKLREVLDKA